MEDTHEGGTRTWTSIGDESMADRFLDDGTKLTREAVAAAIDGMEWVSPDGEHPAMPAYGINAMIGELGIPNVSLIGISSELAPYGLYGVEGNYKNGRARIYGLDTGTGIPVVCSTFWPNEGQVAA